MKNSVETIINLAMTAAKSAGHVFVRIERVIPDEEKHKWNVELNVGTYQKIIKTVVIDDETGKVVSYG